MKKVLLGACALSFIASANANVICDEVSYTGLFGGAGLVLSFDKDVYNLLTFDKATRNKTAFGGQIVIGYGHQFDNNLYVGIMHESMFTSKAKVNYNFSYSTHPHAFAKTGGGAFIADQQRKCWTPSFGLAMGYVVDGWNFGLRAGLQLDKFKDEYNTNNADVKINKNPSETMTITKTSGSLSISATSPYVGAYVEYKMGSFIGYINVDHVFGKKKHGAVPSAGKDDIANPL